MNHTEKALIELLKAKPAGATSMQLSIAVGKERRHARKILAQLKKQGVIHSIGVAPLTVWYHPAHADRVLSAFAKRRAYAIVRKKALKALKNKRDNERRRDSNRVPVSQVCWEQTVIIRSAVGAPSLACGAVRSVFELAL